MGFLSKNKQIKYVHTIFSYNSILPYFPYFPNLSTVFPRIVFALEYFPTFMYDDQRSQHIRLNSKKSSIRGNYSRKYGKSNYVEVKFQIYRWPDYWDSNEIKLELTRITICAFNCELNLVLSRDIFASGQKTIFSIW